MAEVSKVRKRTTRTRSQITNPKSISTRSQKDLDKTKDTESNKTKVATDNISDTQVAEQIYSAEENLKEIKNRLFSSDSVHPDQQNYDSNLVFDYVFVPIILLLVTTICYWNALNCGLVFDDSSAITNNKDIRTTTPIWHIFKNDFWGTPITQEYSHKSYRPVTVLTYRFNYSMTGLDPFYLHLTNILIYYVVCYLVYILSRKFMSSHASIVTTLIFTVHPIHTEAVTGIVGRAELLMSMFSLLAFLTYHHAASKSGTKVLKLVSSTLCQVFICASFFSKEQGLAIVPVLATYELFIARGITFHSILDPVNTFKHLGSGCILRITTIVLTGCVAFGLRLHVMDGQLPEFTRFDNPASYEQFPKKHLTFNYLLPLNLWLLIYPKDLLCDWSMGTIPVIESYDDIRNITTIVFYIILALSVYKTCTCTHDATRFVFVLGLSITILTYLPASNLFVYVGFTVAERVLFMPSVGICLTLGYFCSRYLCGYYTKTQSDSADLNIETQKTFVPTSYRKICSHLIIGTLIILFGYRTHLRNYDWIDDLTLFESGLRVTDRNAKLYNNIGHVYEQRGQLYTALEYYHQAIDRQPDDIGSFINVGRVYNSLKNYEKAREHFLRAKDLLPKPKPGQTYHTRIAPNHLDVYLHLANIEAMDPKNYHTVVSLLSQVIRMRPDYTKARLQLAKFYLDKKAPNEAREAYETALKYSPDDPDIYYNLGVVSYYQDEFGDALNYYEKALTVDPNHKWSLFTSSVVIQEQSYKEYFPLAKNRLLSLIDDHGSTFHQTSDASLPAEAIYYNLAMLTIEEDDDYTEPEKWFKMTLSVQPYHRNALFNLAFILNRMNNTDEASIYLDLLLKRYPNHFKGNMLKGSILYSKGLYEQAEEYYKLAESINPNSTDVKSGLCHIYLNSKGHKYAEAKGCKVTTRVTNELKES